MGGKKERRLASSYAQKITLVSRNRKDSAFRGKKWRATGSAAPGISIF